MVADSVKGGRSCRTNRRRRGTTPIIRGSGREAPLISEGFLLRRLQVGAGAVALAYCGFVETAWI